MTRIKNCFSCVFNDESLLILEKSKLEMQRTIVGLRKKNGTFLIPKFSDCLLEFFGKGINSVTIKCSIENGMLVLSESEEGHELKHSPECPIKLSTDLSEQQNSKNETNTHYVGLAASVVIESSDSHVLLTKRSAQMRASPNVWVLPGGHLELGETIFEAGKREIKEETALDITLDKTSILGIWENVYPLLLGAGSPKYHILVVYFHTQLDKTYKELTKKIIPDPEEVASYCWLNADILSKLFSDDKNIDCDGHQYSFENGNIVKKYLDYCSMFNRWLRIQKEPYSGVNYALRKWKDKKMLTSVKSKF